MTTPTPPTPGPLVSNTPATGEQIPDTVASNQPQAGTGEGEQLNQRADQNSTTDLALKESQANGEGITPPPVTDLTPESNTGEGQPQTGENKNTGTTDTDTDLTNNLGELQELGNKAFHYSGITDTLDTYIEVMNKRNVRYSDGSAQQKALAAVFRTLLRVSDKMFQPVIDAVLARFKDNLGEGLCFNELKRGAHLIAPNSTSKNPVATFSNKEEYAFFNNMMALCCQIADPKGRRDVLNRINIEAVFAPVQKDKNLTNGINRFVEYLREQR